MQDIIIFLITNLLFGFVAKALASIGLGQLQIHLMCFVYWVIFFANYFAVGFYKKKSPIIINSSI
jgi:hypothetical protein